MYVRVRTVPSARIEKVRKVNDSLFEIHVKQKPENNAVNKRICEILSFEFKVRVGQVRIINGHQQPNKLIEIRKETINKDILSEMKSKVSRANTRRITRL